MRRHCEERVEPRRAIQDDPDRSWEDGKKRDMGGCQKRNHRVIEKREREERQAVEGKAMDGLKKRRDRRRVVGRGGVGGKRSR